MPTSPARTGYALVADASVDPKAAAAALDRAADTGRGRAVLVCCDPAVARRIRRNGSHVHATRILRTWPEAAAVVKALRPVRIGFLLEEPLEFSALLLDRHRLEAAAS